MQRVQRMVGKGAKCAKDGGKMFKACKGYKAWGTKGAKAGVQSG